MFNTINIFCFLTIVIICGAVFFFMYERRFLALICLLLSLFLCIGSYYAKREYSVESYRNINLFALSDSSEYHLSGSYCLIAGNVSGDEQMVCRYLYEGNDGLIYPGSVSMNAVSFDFKSDEHYLQIQKRKVKVYLYGKIPIGSYYCNAYVFTIPKESVTSDFNIDLK